MATAKHFVVHTSRPSTSLLFVIESFLPRRGREEKSLGMRLYLP